MLKRKAYDYLIHWRNSKEKECLLIKGARQVGKTFLVEQFGENEYKSFIEINFLKEPNLKSIFSGALDADSIYRAISIMKPGSKFIPGDTLIFLDEIQRCSSARTALKFLAQDNRYDVIASGSLLGLHYGMDADNEVEAVESIPVGFESQLIMYSLDFEEFLWSRGVTVQEIDNLKEHFDSGREIREDVVNKKYEDLFKEYIIVGGMPEVVNAFVKTNDFGVVKEKQEKILASYDDDISNHAKKVEKAKIRRCYDSIPRQLANENKKFCFSEVEKRTGSKKYGDSIIWLRDSNLVHTCFNVYQPLVPLKANSKDDEFKLYINDTGLLMAMYGDTAKQMIFNGTMRGNAKGGIYENVIAECLVKKGYTLHYYKPVENTQEIEFVIEKDGGVVPIEVKAGNTSTVSLNKFIEHFNPTTVYKLIDGNVGTVGTKHTIPHYMIIFI